MRTAFLLLFVASSALSRAADDLPIVSYQVPKIGGWAIDDKLETLVLSSPETAEILFVDTVGAGEPRAVKVPFKPNRLALRGDQLFASVEGSTLVYAMDSKTCKVLRRYKLPGTAIHSLACHPSKGPVLASNADEEVILLDPEGTEARRTSAHGTFLSVDSKTGKHLFSATNRPSEEVVEFKRTVGGVIRARLVTVAENAAVLKYEIGSDDLTLVGGNPNGAVGAGGYLHVAPDGERYAMVAGGGWRSPADARIRHDIAIFEAEDMTTMLGGLNCGAPQVICFHPVLEIGVAQGNNRDFYVFEADSLVRRSLRRVDAIGPVKYWLNMLAIGGRGTRMVTLQGHTLHMIPLELTPEEKGALTKRFGRLPNLSEGGTTIADATPAKPPVSATTPARTTRPRSSSTSPVVALPDGSNWKLADAKARTPYMLDRAYELQSVPSQLDGGTLLVRPAGNVRNWLESGQLSVLRDGTAYVALLSNFNGREAISKATLETLESEGWKIEKDRVGIQPTGGNEVWIWTVLSRKVAKGPLDISSQVELREPTQAVFLFK